MSAAEAATAANAVSAASAIDWAGRQNTFGLLLASEQSLFDFIGLMFPGYLRLLAPLLELLGLLELLNQPCSAWLGVTLELRHAG